MRPARAKPQAPDGFAGTLFAEGLEAPRVIRTTPNGDLFTAETSGGRIRVLRPGADVKLVTNSVYASGLSYPFGIAFYPAGPNPKWLYVAENNRVVRFSYHTGDLHTKLAPEIIVPRLAQTDGGHVTRDAAFSNDDARMFVSAGSATKDAEGGGQERCALRERRSRRHGVARGIPSSETLAVVVIVYFSMLRCGTIPQQRTQIRSPGLDLD